MSFTGHAIAVHRLQSSARYSLIILRLLRSSAKSRKSLAVAWRGRRRLGEQPIPQKKKERKKKKKKGGLLSAWHAGKYNNRAPPLGFVRVRAACSSFLAAGSCGARIRPCRFRPIYRGPFSRRRAYSIRDYHDERIAESRGRGEPWCFCWGQGKRGFRFVDCT